MPGTGAEAIWRGNPTSFTSQPARPGHRGDGPPVSGDFTGDNYDDLLAYVPGTTPDKVIPGRPPGL